MRVRAQLGEPAARAEGHAWLALGIGIGLGLGWVLRLGLGIRLAEGHAFGRRAVGAARLLAGLGPARARSEVAVPVHGLDHMVHRADEGERLRAHAVGHLVQVRVRVRVN